MKFIKVKHRVYADNDGNETTIEILLSISAIVSIKSDNFNRIVHPVLYKKQLKSGIVFVSAKNPDNNYEYIEYFKEKTIPIEAATIITANEHYSVENSVAEIEEMIKNA